MMKGDRVRTKMNFSPRAGEVLTRGSRGRIVDVHQTLEQPMYEVDFDGIGRWAVPAEIIELAPGLVTMTSSMYERTGAADELLRERVAILLDTLEELRCGVSYPEKLATGIRAVSEALRHARAAAPTTPVPAADEPWRKDWPEGWPACTASTCKEPASFGYVWPGKGRLHACFADIVRVLRVAEALGLSARSLEIETLLKNKP